MSLSEKLSELSVSARKLEESAESARLENKEKIAARKAELGEKLDAAHAQAQADGAAAKNKIAEAFASLRDKAATKKAQTDAARSEHHAQVAEDDALIAVNYAIYAIDEAEYAILYAVDARVEADGKSTGTR